VLELRWILREKSDLSDWGNVIWPGTDCLMSESDGVRVPGAIALASAATSAENRDFAR
jgi:hypothetical protein